MQRGSADFTNKWMDFNFKTFKLSSAIAFTAMIVCWMDISEFSFDDFWPEQRHGPLNSG